MQALIRYIKAIFPIFLLPTNVAIPPEPDVLLCGGGSRGCCPALVMVFRVGVHHVVVSIGVRLYQRPLNRREIKNKFFANFSQTFGVRT